MGADNHFTTVPGTLPTNIFIYRCETCGKTELTQALFELWHCGEKMVLVYERNSAKRKGGCDYELNGKR